MTRTEVEQLTAALAEYRKQTQAYRNSYDAIGAYKKADDELRRLLWLHGAQLIEQASPIRCACCGCTRRNEANTWFVCDCNWLNPADVDAPEVCERHR